MLNKGEEKQMMILTFSKGNMKIMGGLDLVGVKTDEIVIALTGGAS